MLLSERILTTQSITATTASEGTSGIRIEALLLDGFVHLEHEMQESLLFLRVDVCIQYLDLGLFGLHKVYQH